MHCSPRSDRLHGVRPTTIVRLLLWLVITACSPTDRGPPLDVDRVLAHVATLTTTIGPRGGDTPQAKQAAEYIETQLPGQVGRMMVGTIELPAIVVMSATYRQPRRAVTTDPDLVVRFGPRDGKALLVMAHYDTVAASPGAVDNAAAVGVLIELARVLAQTPPSRPVMLVFTANEETGLVGAEALAASLGDEVDFAIALDLIGGSGALSLNGASELIGTAELRWLAEAAGRAGVVLRAPLAHRVVSRWWPQAERSDHGPFTRRGVRAVHLYHRGQDGEWIDLAYHSERDVMSRVDRASVDELGRLLRALAASPIPAHGGDGFWVPLAVNTVVPRWWLVVACCVLAMLAIAMLVTLRSARAAVLGRSGLLAGIGCFVVAVGAAYAVERAGAADHPAPWLHAPVRAVVAELLVLAGAFGLATRLFARFGPWSGGRRYLVLAVVAPLVTGCALLVIGAAELAWIWLLPAAIAAFAPRLGRAGLLALVPLALPLVLALDPDQLREAAWNGFLPIGLPLAAWIAGLGFPLIAGIGWYLRAHPCSGPLGTFLLPMGCLLAILTGAIAGISVGPACTAAQFHEFHLACESVLGVR